MGLLSKDLVLRAVADSWWPRTYVVRAGRKVQGKLQLPALPLTGGTIVVDSERSTVARAGLLRQRLRLVRSGQKVARAWGFARWRIEHGDDLLTLWPVRFQHGRYKLCHGRRRPRYFAASPWAWLRFLRTSILNRWIF